ncbi:MAG: DUF1365 family protein [Candidatus Sumerlaeia bacterium]|nr:DUF1365 family protein [Candidatus Sumerlaeia bacterium]
MNSAIYVGEVMHARLGPVRHAFKYPVYIFGFDLDELPDLDRRIPLFGYNRRAVVSLHDADYFRGERESLRERAIRALREKGVGGEIGRVMLITAARTLGYVFNPVSFYYFFRPDGTLAGNLAEVNNTFHERHLYVLTEPRAARDGFLARYTVPKDFHVSPFNDLQGEYDFHFSDIRDHLDIRIDILRDGSPAFRTWIKGTPQPMTPSALARTLARFPLRASLTMPRILIEAAKLHYRKKLPVYTKPNPASAMTIKVAPPSPMQRAGLAFVTRLFSGIRHGKLVLELPDRTCREFGNPAAADAQILAVRNYDFFARLIREGDIGLGSSYIAGDWESPNLVGLLELFCDNFHLVSGRSLLARTMGRLATEARTFLQRNTLTGSRRNIAAHYDLGNDFFGAFLDSTMMYSSGLFLNPEDTLEAAQRNKIERLLDLADIREGHEVLEIGSGWGTFAIEAARSRGARVTTLTLSREQHRHVAQRIQDEGLADRVQVVLQDYRETTGQFDRIVSIEMLEAVGHENLGSYFAACDRVLKPGGRVALQVITVPDQRYDSYRRHGDFIERHIFPGSVCPSLTAMSNAMTESSALVVERLENIGPHYAETLARWRDAFTANWATIRSQGFDESFRRRWEYYLAYCEAGFRKRLINNLHLVLARPGQSA